jgi:CDP-diacylglycerol---glycerol-3-phosphate 3-phosphatidyltransferase
MHESLETLIRYDHEYVSNAFSDSLLRLNFASGASVTANTGILDALYAHGACFAISHCPTKCEGACGARCSRLLRPPILPLAATRDDLDSWPDNSDRDQWIGRSVAERGSDLPTYEGFGWQKRPGARNSGVQSTDNKAVSGSPLAAILHSLNSPENSQTWLCHGVRVRWTPNKVTLLRVAVGFAAVSLFGRGAWANLAAVGLTVLSIALDALDGYIARTKKLATPMGAQIDILGDRMIENVYFTYFAVVGMVSLWLPVFFFARGAATDFLRGLAMRAGHSGWGANAMLRTWWGRALVASRWSRGTYAAMKCLCFCYLGLGLALARGPVALIGELAADAKMLISTGAQVLTWATAGFCLVRGLPVLLEGWKYLTDGVVERGAKSVTGKIA